MGPFQLGVLMVLGFHWQSSIKPANARLEVAPGAALWLSITPQCCFHLPSSCPKAAEAARLLLTDLWSNRELQSVLKQVRRTPLRFGWWHSPTTLHEVAEIFVRFLLSFLPLSSAPVALPCGHITPIVRITSTAPKRNI